MRKDGILINYKELRIFDIEECESPQFIECSSSIKSHNLGTTLYWQNDSKRMKQTYRIILVFEQMDLTDC